MANDPHPTPGVWAGVVGAAILGRGLYLLSKGARAYFRKRGKPEDRAAIHLIDWQGRSITIVRTGVECKRACEGLKINCTFHRYLGFICVWSGKNPVSLLQLSDFLGNCVIIRLTKLDWIPSVLQDLLEDSSILKLGVRPEIDKDSLLRDYNLITNGTLDLRFVRCLTGLDDWLGEGLSAMALQHLGVLMGKPLNASDWEAHELTMEQVEFAAHDATMAVDLYQFFLAYGCSSKLTFCDKVWE